MNTNEVVRRYAKIMAVKEVFATHPYWDNDNSVYPNEDVLAEWYDVVVNDQPPTQRVRDMCEAKYDAETGTSAYDIDDACATDGEYLYFMCEQYEFCTPRYILEDKCSEYEMHLTEFVKYMEETK